MMAATLSQWLESWIERLSDPAERAREAAMFSDALVLRMGGLGRAPWAEIVIQSDSGQPMVVAEFGNGPRLRNRLDRVTELPFSALLACGELLEGPR